MDSNCATPPQRADVKWSAGSRHRFGSAMDSYSIRCPSGRISPNLDPQAVDCWLDTTSGLHREAGPMMKRLATLLLILLFAAPALNVFLSAMARDAQAAGLPARHNRPGVRRRHYRPRRMPSMLKSAGSPFP